MRAPISLAIGLALLVVVANANDVCYDPSVDFFPLMGTRTAYELVHGHEKLRSLPSSTCQPLQIWGMIRHGTKYPENSDILKMMNITKFRDQIIDNHKSGAGELCAKDLESFRNWKLDPNINESTDEELSAQGEKDLLELGQRLKKAFPELFSPSTFNANDYTFKTTNRQRTIVSMSSFIKGILGNEAEQLGYRKTTVSDNDTMLLPHKNCEAWNKEYEEDEELTKQQKTFIKGKEFKAVLSKLTKRLGFQYDLDFGTVKTAYDMCRYEVAWYPEKVSTWCSIFNQEDLKIFEYSEDLDYYYTCGPGREMSHKLGCGALANMYSHFKALESGETKDQPKGVFNFAHTMTLQTVLSALRIGIQKQPFTYDSYATSQNRTYHVSKLGPFATNVLAVFYKCPGTKPEQRISLHVAEDPAVLDNCPNGVCDWDYVKKEYGPSAESCSMDFCKPSSAVRSVGMGMILSLILAIAVSN